MNLEEYFENTQGIGILATADSSGEVDLAIYARPHVVDESTIAFVMSDRLSHRNVSSNPRAAYMFVEGGSGYSGKRLYLTKVREEADPAVVEAMRRGGQKHGQGDTGGKWVVYFKIEKIRPLVGD